MFNFFRLILHLLGIYQAIFYCETFLTLCRFRSLDNDESKTEIMIYYQQEFIANIFEKVIKFEKNIHNHEIDLQVSNQFFRFYFVITIVFMIKERSFCMLVFYLY